MGNHIEFYKNKLQKFNIPEWIEESILKLINSNKAIDLAWECYWSELNADLNAAENNGEISPSTADSLRDIYLYEFWTKDDNND